MVTHTTYLRPSSGESDYYALVEGASIAIGLKSMLADVHVNLDHIHTTSDASSAIGIASRRGLGRGRHIEGAELWIQEKVASGEVKLVKDPGTFNLADALTKNLNAEPPGYHCKHM